MKNFIISLLTLLFLSLPLFPGCDSGEVDISEGIQPAHINQSQPDTEAVHVYFIRIVDGVESLQKVEREVPSDNCIVESTLIALLDGVTDEEKAMGYSSSIPPDTELLSFELDKRVAVCNFSRAIEPGGGSAWVMAIRDQITKTLEQFDNVDQVEIMVESEREDVLQP